MSLDPTDILGTFFQLLSEASSSSSSQSGLPFYLDSSKNLFQNTNNASGSVSTSDRVIFELFLEIIFIGEGSDLRKG